MGERKITKKEVKEKKKEKEKRREKGKSLEPEKSVAICEGRKLEERARNGGCWKSF